MLRPALWLPACALLALAAPLAEAQAKPAFRNGEQVEAQGPDGRWYQAKVWKVKAGAPPQYELRFEGMPPSAALWLTEDKVRASGGGAVVDPECVKARLVAEGLFQQVVAHGKQGKWADAGWNKELDALTDRFEASVKAVQAKWPQEPLGRLATLPERLRANTALRRKEQASKPAPQAAAPDESVALEAFYRSAAQAADGVPYTVSADTMAGCKAVLEALDLGALEARIAADAQRFPEVFAYYGREDKGTYGDFKYGGPKAPAISDANLKRIHQFHLPKIYKTKARLSGQEQALADAVAVAMKKAKNVDEALYALGLARAVRACQPANPHIAARIKEAQGLVESKLGAFAALMKGPFHREHMRELVAFSSAQSLGQEDAQRVVTELVPGKPLYLVGYLSESVKDLGFKRRDSQLGYETTRLPDLKFRFKEVGGEPWRLPVYSKVTGDGLASVGAVVIDLMPDPSTTYETHLAYLPALHFTRWLLEQKPGVYTLELSATPSLELNRERQGAHGELKVSLSAESLAALQVYYDALWAKKLSTVVYPDEFGVQDRKGEIPNADHLAKYGKLLKLTCAETNKVMKPFPHQTEVANFVGQGYGLFETQGRYRVLPLSFSRQPDASVLSWANLRGVPDDYALRGPSEILPTVLEFGYEIPKANLAKTGAWR